MASLLLVHTVSSCRGALQLLHKQTWAEASRNRLMPLKHVVCGLRDNNRPRKPLWRGRIMTTEAIQAVQALKRANKYSQDKVDHVCITRVSRLLKDDLLAALSELQRQNEYELAIKIFDLVRKEVWYKPDIYLYADMIMLMARNKLIDKAEELFSLLKEEGLDPDTRVCTELLGGYTCAGMIEKAMEIYEMMKVQSGCKPNELTFTILLNSLERVEERVLANVVRKDAFEYLDDPTKVLNNVANTVATH